MSRLIDADALIKVIDKLPHSYNGWSDAYDKSFIIQTIEDAPTIEPCEDAISRAEMLKLIDEEYDDGSFLSEYESGRRSMNQTLRRWTEQLPSVAPSRPSGEWIPCSERLPSIGDSGVSDMVLLCWSDGQRTVGSYQGNRTFVGQAWPVARDCRVTVIAWMPLPEPYKESE